MSTYVHGTSPTEQDRLSLLNDLVNEASLGQLSLRGGERVLEVGSGLGQLARAMARVAGRGKVVGIERSSDQLARARRLAQEAGEDALVDFRQGDALALPLAESEWGSFDLVHARFLLEHLADPASAVRGMVRAVRPGGRIVLEDDDHSLMRLWPEPPGFGTLWEAYLRTYDRLGNDPYVGRRLVALLHEAGAQPARNTWLFFGSCAGHPNLNLYVTNLIQILDGARAHLLSAGMIRPEYLASTLVALEEWQQRPDATFWYGIAWAEGVRKS